MRLPFGWGKSRAAGARAASRQRPAQPRGRPSWYWLVDKNGHSQAIIPIEKELAVYDDIRRLFPIVDVAIDKIIRLTGGIRVEGSTRAAEECAQWMARVQVNQTGRGLESWLSTHLDQMLMYGKGVGEIVPDTTRRDVYALTNLEARTILLKAGNSPLELRIFQRQQQPAGYVELTPGWFLHSVHRPRGDDPHGTSLLRSVPWVCEVLSCVQNAIAQHAERTGAPSFHVNWQPDEQFEDPDGTLATSVVDNLATQFAATMEARKSGDVQDFFTSGAVTVKTIGADNMMPQAPDVVYRLFAEQLIAATGLPSWLLGLHWASTERLSTVQAEMILADIMALRREVQPQLEYLIDLRQRLGGKSGRVKLSWQEITLTDLIETTRAEAWRETTRVQAVERAARMWQLGWWTQLQAGQEVDERITAVAQVHAAPPAAAGHAAQGLAPGQQETH